MAEREITERLDRLENHFKVYKTDMVDVKDSLKEVRILLGGSALNGNKGFIKLYRSPDGDGGAGGEGEGEGAEGGEGEGAGAGAGGDKGQKPWYDSLDTDLKTNPTITKFKSPAELGKSYVELQKAFGKDKVVVPTDKSTPEEWAATSLRCDGKLHSSRRCRREHTDRSEKAYCNRNT